MRIGLFQRLQLTIPPGIGFHEQHQVRADPLHKRQQRCGVAVLDQHVRHQQPDARLRLAACQHLRFGCDQRRVGPDGMRLPCKRSPHGGGEGPRPPMAQGQQQGRRDQHGRQQDGDLETWKIPDPYGGCVARNERQHRHEDGEPAQPEQRPAHNLHQSPPASARPAIP